ncbi:MAG: hypothetical protein Q7T71_08675 [Herbiconiux sp.]|nr:hypothetical protein [Herbiconiux sp.]
MNSPLTVDPGVWTREGLTFTCAWFIGTTKVGTTCSYTPKPADLGKDVFVKVTGAKNCYLTSQAYSSAAVRVIAAPGATATRSPVIAGTATVGELLTLDRGDWVTPSGAGYSYQWYRNGVAVPGKTSFAYAVGADDGRRARHGTGGEGSQAHRQHHSEDQWHDPRRFGADRHLRHLEQVGPALRLRLVPQRHGHSGRQPLELHALGSRPRPYRHRARHRLLHRLEQRDGR